MKKREYKALLKMALVKRADVKRAKAAAKIVDMNWNASLKLSLDRNVQLISENTALTIEVEALKRDLPKLNEMERNK